MIAKKVCAIGGATLDLIIAYEDMEMMTLENTDSARNYLLLEEGSKIEVSDLHYYSGGGATNAAVTFTRQGLDVYLFCKIGDDSAGKMASKQKPKQLDIKLPDLLSRLQWVLAFKVHPLNDEDLIIAIKDKFSQKGFYVSKDVISFMLHRLDRIITDIMDKIYPLPQD